MEHKPYSYKTLAQPSDMVVFTERKSKFYGYAFPINEIEAVKPLLEGLRQKYPKANHICYAWQLGVENVEYRANDDGEPRNSAGAPIYSQIQSFGMTNVLVAVVRFFGGTKLGVGGLIHTYRTTARMALEGSAIIEKKIKIGLKLTFEYPVLNSVMQAVKREKLEIISQTLEMDCSINVLCDKKDMEGVLEVLKSIQGLRLEIMDQELSNFSKR